MSRDHSAFEQFVGDRRGDAVQELAAHLRIFVQQADEARFLFRFLRRRPLAALRR